LYLKVVAKLVSCGFRAVSYHIALVSDDVCECCTHTYPAAVVGFILLRRIHHSLSSYTRHAEKTGSFYENFEI